MTQMGYPRFHQIRLPGTTPVPFSLSKRRLSIDWRVCHSYPVRVSGELLSAAGDADQVLRRLMPKPNGAMTYGAVAKRCRCAASTPRSWLLRDDDISVPELRARQTLLRLVDQQEGEGARAVLENAWTQLLLGDEVIDLTTGGQGDLATIEAEIEAGQTKRGLSLAERRTVVAQARVLLEDVYAHLPFKRALHAVDPVQRLRLLDHRLSEQNEGEQAEDDFHREMMNIFTSVRDLHTTYIVPEPQRSATVLLPFRVEEFFDTDDAGEHHATYVATKVTDEDAVGAGFVEGVTITHWNGVPIARAIRVLADRQAAGNEPAAHVRALDALTIRPLLSSMVPDEIWVDVTYRTDDEKNPVREQRFHWARHNAEVELLPDHLETELGLDAQTHVVSSVRKELYGNKNNDWTPADEHRCRLKVPLSLGGNSAVLETHIPWKFRAHPTADGRFGYIRIFSFPTRRPQLFIDEFARLTTLLPPEGLIVDVRGNGGGSIQAAEGILQVLSKQPVRAARSQFVASPLVLDICRTRPELSPWVDSLRQAAIIGATHSRGFPITPQAVLDKNKTRYPGPVVLIVDGICYSATDIFTAGFIDHEVGAVLGASGNTGAGGGNVLTHKDLLKLAGPDTALEKLPGGVNFRVAVRRTLRVHAHEGEILEDLGVELTDRHHMTRRDVFEGNVDLIQRATELLDALAAVAPNPPTLT